MFGLDLIAAHMVGDYILQTDHMAANKLHDWRIRLMHVTLYALPFALLMLLYDAAMTEKLVFMALLWATHFVTDSRRSGAPPGGGVAPGGRKGRELRCAGPSVWCA